jgi:hypothetical protein
MIAEAISAVPAQSKHRKVGWATRIKFFRRCFHVQIAKPNDNSVVVAAADQPRTRTPSLNRFKLMSAGGSCGGTSAPCEYTNGITTVISSEVKIETKFEPQTESTLRSNR